MKRVFLFLFLFLVSFNLVYSNTGDNSEDPWSENNFEDSCKKNPAECMDKDPVKAMEIDPVAAMEANPELCMLTDLDKAMQTDPVAGIKANPGLGIGYVESSDPDLITDVEILDLVFTEDSVRGAKIINSKVDLLDDLNVLERFESEIESNIGLLNENGDAKSKWFSNKGVTLDGDSPESFVEILSFKGSVIQTAGLDATSFDISNPFLQGSRITTEGKLILMSGTEIANANVDVVDDILNVLGLDGNVAKVQISDSNVFNVVVENGDVEFLGKKFNSEGGTKFEVIFDDGGFKFVGVDINEFDIVSGDKLFTYSGEVNIYSDGHKMFGEDTKVTKYLRGDSSFTFSVSKETLYYFEAGMCDGSNSCIEDFGSASNLPDYQAKVIHELRQYLKYKEIIGDFSIGDMVDELNTNLMEKYTDFDSDGFEHDTDVNFLRELSSEVGSDKNLLSWSKEELDSLDSKYDDLYDLTGLNSDSEYLIIKEFIELKEDPNFDLGSWVKSQDESSFIVNEISSQIQNFEEGYTSQLDKLITISEYETKSKYLNDEVFSSMDTDDKNMFSFAKGTIVNFDDVDIEHKIGQIRSRYVHFDYEQYRISPEYIFNKNLERDLDYGDTELIGPYLEDLDSRLSLNIFSKDDNVINLDVNTKLISSLNVNSIDDGSIVSVKDEEVNLLFSDNPLKIKGVLNELSIGTVSAGFVDSSGESHLISIMGGKIDWDATNSGSIVNGKFIVDEKYSKDKADIGSDWGVLPSGVIGFIDQNYIKEESELLKKLVGVADNLKLDREIFIMTFMQEGGMDILLENDGLYDPNFVLDNYGGLGADTLIVDGKRLLDKDYLPEDYFDRTVNDLGETDNEHDLRVSVAAFKLTDMIIGVGALLKDKIDYATGGSNNIYSELSDEDKLWIQYASYNAGQGTANNILTGQDFKWGDGRHPPLKSAEEVSNFIHLYRGSTAPGEVGKINSGLHFNVGRTVGGALLLKKYLDIDEVLSDS